MLSTEDPLARAVVAAIRTGDTTALRRLLATHPGLATERIGGGGESRSLLHVAADWPGHFPNGRDTVAVLVAAGADPNAAFEGGHRETPLHWAASSDDVAVLDALLDHGAELEAPGGVIAGGTPLDDARAFAQWNAAHRLVERGARTALHDAATLGLAARLAELLAADPPPTADEVTRSFWGACHGGQQAMAETLLARGADPSWVPPWEPCAPIDAAERRGATGLVAWLRAIGAPRSAPRSTVGAGTRASGATRHTARCSRCRKRSGPERSTATR